MIPAIQAQTIGIFQSTEQKYTIKILEGDAMLPWLEELAKMQALYEEWPYFCCANLAEDRESIERIMNLNGVASVAFDEKGKLSGVAMGRPQELVSCVNKAFPNEARVFHMQHWLVLPEHRNKKVASTLYTALENHVRATGRFDRISCATVILPNDFRLPAPPNAFSLDASFQKRSFTRFKPETEFSFVWQLIDEPNDTKHPMALWMKDLH